MRKYTYVVILVVAGFACTRPAYCQLNESDSLRWQFKASATASLLNGILDRFITVNKLEAGHALEHFGFSTRNDYQYGTFGPSTTENDLTSFNYIYLNPRSRVYPYLMVLAEVNYRRQLTQRYQPGVGVSWNVMRKPHHFLKLSATASYETSTYKGTRFTYLEDTTRNVVNTARLTARAYGRHRLFNNKLRAFYEFWFQQSVQVQQNYRLYAEAALELPITKHFSFRANGRFTYENIQLLGLKPYDLYATLGVSISSF